MSENQDSEDRDLAANTLSQTQQTCAERKTFFDNKLARNRHGRHGNSAPGTAASQNIVPDHLLDHIASSSHTDEEEKDAAQQTISTNQQIRAQRSAPPAEAKLAATDDGDSTVVERSVYDMHNQQQMTQTRDTTYELLPGDLIRSEGQPAVDDHTVNEAYDNCGKVLEFYKQIFDHNSLDNENMPIVSAVHYKQKWQNAAWMGGDIKTMVYGDGGGALYNFTACLDVIGHEMTHGVTEYNSMLRYENESGALNEHISDVFGIMVKQFAEKQTAKDSDWLIGEGCLMPDIKGVALRSMKSPGTAYDDPEKFGTDPQPANYSGLVAMKKDPKYAKMLTKDNGGVHIFSGIPNRAFFLCAEAFKGYSWEKAGKIWWTTVTTDRILPNCKFIQFADATVDVAEELFGAGDAKKVRDAWNTVGVKKSI